MFLGAGEKPEMAMVTCSLTLCKSRLERPPALGCCGPGARLEGPGTSLPGACSALTSDTSGIRWPQTPYLCLRQPENLPATCGAGWPRPGRWLGCGCCAGRAQWSLPA